MILSSNSKNPRAITKAEIGDILSLSKTDLEQFISECTNNNILLFNKQKWFINTDYFSRGCFLKAQSAQVRKVQKDIFLQIYRNNINNLDYIGGLLRLSPYLHDERNYLCSNPGERRPDKIIPMPTADIQRVLGRDPEFLACLLDELQQIVFECDGKVQQLCRVDMDGKERLIMINPNVIYTGSPPEYKQICLELYWGYEDPFDRPFYNYPSNPIKGSTLAYVNRANA